MGKCCLDLARIAECVLLRKVRSVYKHGCYDDIRDSTVFRRRVLIIQLSS